MSGGDFGSTSRPRPWLRVSLELTDGCDFGCVHCFRTLAEHPRFLDLELVRRLLAQLEAVGPVGVVALTGGEPTLHPQLGEIIGAIAEHGHRFGMVTNGWRFRQASAAVEAHRERLDAVSFSLDGATAAVHDRLRRKGSFRRVVEALMHCRERGLPTQVNMVVTPANRHQLHEMAQLVTALGCRALGLAHCMPTPDTVAAGLVMGLGERRRLEADIASLQQTYRLPILLAGDHYDPFALALCPQLALEELHVDVNGRLLACCQLSSYRGGEAGCEVVADLTRTPLAEAMVALADRVAGVIRLKAERLAAGQVDEGDRFICTACLRHHRKVDERLLPSALDPTL